MQYRLMASTGDRLSVLGYGTMRLPERGGRIDEARATRQIRSAIDRGVNYVDTAVPYHLGAAEPFLARALADGYRQKVHLATKLPHWHVREPSDLEAALAGQLSRLGTDRIDYYLVHNLSAGAWERLKPLGIREFLSAAKSAGRIGHIGFSSHCGREDFQRILDDFSWEFCQIQLNILDEEMQAGVAGMEYAASRGVGVIVMEPLRGGGLALASAPSVRALWESAETHRSPAEWALRWVWDRPEVSVALSGMNVEEHIEENIRVASEALPRSLSVAEHELIHRVRDAWRALLKVGCTGCRYCMPCPHGVDIPGCFHAWNTAHMEGVRVIGSSAITYLTTVGGAFSRVPPGFASRCRQCGKCVSRCPQHIDIPKALALVRREMEGPMFPLMKVAVGAYQRLDRRRSVRKSRRA